MPENLYGKLLDAYYTDITESFRYC